MKIFATLCSVLAAASIILSACQISSGAAELTPLGPSLVEMTATASPATATQDDPLPSTLTLTPTPTRPPLPTTPPPSVITVRVAPPSATQPPPISGGPAAPPTACPNAWFTSVPTVTCPDGPPLVGDAAAQPFERGWMVWLKSSGQYLILIKDDGFRQVNDPLTVTGDTSASFAAPGGLHAPISGFGLVWRGDTAQTAGSGLPELLGWATGPEFGY